MFADTKFARGLWRSGMGASCALLTLLFGGIASYCSAQELGLRSDITLQRFHDWQNPFADRSLVFKDYGQPRSALNEAYIYEFPEISEKELGVFQLRENGGVCVGFTNKNNDCDLYIRKNELFLLRHESEGRLPTILEFSVKP
ncbi:hypothetical protein PEL8287_03466 [Roseovarius litorisediminis]|uniref:Uncharacterized protein n=1 Tax=Roseovarius litorisediminis TaxID=1312363 RepID=A0A1Y5TM91_9RHOB|nr:hypothetical protein [Roseovarius litorisediminis]SLN63503.1 hypothetical protein PEL8287_03466 [Roseovarius litorisediminis]